MQVAQTAICTTGGAYYNIIIERAHRHLEGPNICRAYSRRSVREYAFHIHRQDMNMKRKE